MDNIKIGFIGFGEVNTPKNVISYKCGEALEALKAVSEDIVSKVPVTDDENYEDADGAIREMLPHSFDLLVVCIAGWIPTHAVIRVIDHFRYTPMLLWSLCGTVENGKIVSTADQAGATALRFAMQAMHYKFTYLYNVVGKPMPIDKIKYYANACYACRKLRDARIGTMGYRDMLLYGTMFDGLRLRSQIGVEVEPFEMLEIEQKAQKVTRDEIEKGIAFVRENWTFTKPCEDETIGRYVSYALTIADKIRKRKYDAISLIDVDGMKKLLNLPPAMIFMLLDRYCKVCTVPENDVMGSVTQLMVRYCTNQIAAYAEFYEFFEDSFLVGVPDFIPYEVTEGEALIMPAAFGQLSTSLLNVSKYKSGTVTLARLIDFDGKYRMHLLKGEAKQPRPWEECGWEAPAPQLPSLEITPEYSVKEFSEKVSSQHIILAYGDHVETLTHLCRLLDVEVL